MATKYDTNPLDPDFPEKVKEAQTKTLPNNNNETAKFPPAAETEEQTRYHDKAKFADYASRFNGAQPLNHYETAHLHAEQPANRKVAKIGLPENILIALPYIPFYVGMIAGVLELLFVPKSEAKVRFHAAQGLAAHIGVLLVTTILGVVGNLPGLGLADAGNFFFQIAATVMLIIFAVKAWKGKPVHIESVDSLTEWLEDKIKPQK